MNDYQNRPKKGVTRTVELAGIRPLMFDRYAGDNNTKLEWYQKLYRLPGSTLIYMPALNIVSFLSAEKTDSAPKRLLPSKEYKKTAQACLSYVDIIAPDGSDYIPILRDGKPIEVPDIIEGERDEKSGIYLNRAVARMAGQKGLAIPNPKARPVLPTPWSIVFTINIRPNTQVQEQQVYNLFQSGGECLGLGTFRGVYGKFEILRWE